jgi:hypothetical protein
VGDISPIPLDDAMAKQIEVAQSRLWRHVFVKDRAAARESARRVLELPARPIVVAHGEPIEASGVDEAQARLRGALGWMAGAT